MRLNELSIVKVASDDSLSQESSARAEQHSGLSIHIFNRSLFKNSRNRRLRRRFPRPSGVGGVQYVCVCEQFYVTVRLSVCLSVCVCEHFCLNTY